MIQHTPQSLKHLGGGKERRECHCRRLLVLLVELIDCITSASTLQSTSSFKTMMEVCCNRLEHPVLAVNTVFLIVMERKKKKRTNSPYQFLSAVASLVTNSLDTRFKFQTGSLGAAQRWWVLVSFSRLDRHKRAGIGNPREEQPGLSEMSVCLGHFLLTSPPPVTAVLPARDIPRRDFLPFCLGSLFGPLHRCLCYCHCEKTIVNESAP